MKYFVDEHGQYLGAFEGLDAPDGAVEVGAPPQDASQVWDGETGQWGDVPALTLASRKRAERDARILAVSWRFERHASETRLGLTPTDDVAALDAYAQALRDVPGQPGFPATINWPELPE